MILHLSEIKNKGHFKVTSPTHHYVVGIYCNLPGHHSSFQFKPHYTGLNWKISVFAKSITQMEADETKKLRGTFSDIRPRKKGENRKGWS